jgi:hypothetical protein
MHFFHMKRIILLTALSLLPLCLEARSPRPVGVNVARTYPYSMVGQLTFFNDDSQYVATGTVVQPYGVLTAAHNLYDAVGGWSTDLVFKRAQYDNTALSARYASRSYVFGGYQSSVQSHGADDPRSFARDTGGLSFQARPAAGGFLGWTTDRSILTTDAPKALFGYGAVVHSGNQLLVVGATPFSQVYSNFYESYNTGIEAGMSGGPVIATLPDGNRAVCGVVVSGSQRPVTGGIRIVNSTTSDFILRYLAGPATR